MPVRPDNLRDRLLTLPTLRVSGDAVRNLLASLPDDTEIAEGATTVLLDTVGALGLLGADVDVIATALADAVPAWRPALESRVPAITPLLEGLAAAHQVWSLHAEHASEGNPEGLRRLLLALIRDLRLVLVLLARQLALMRAAVRSEDDVARRALASLTRDVHAPLANRLGIWQLKWELEDLAFRYLEPETYRRIAGLLDDKRSGREGYIEQVRVQLGEALAAQGVRGEVAGRPKHIYSIWKKMQRKQVPIGELYDLRAVRVLVDDIPGCYAALGVVHALWTPIPSEFDDYIARPKHNDYRSLHTAVVGPDGKTLEVQIRTREMHEASELGVAAHWRYKETGGSQRSSAGNAALERRIEWMRRLLDAHTEPARDGDPSLAGALGTELVEDRVFVLTPKGEIVDLPQGATPLDFAYHVHTMVGHRCRGAKVDGRIVPLDSTLHSGQRVEILTAKTPAPRRDWLVAANGFLASARSREKVRNWFHKLDRARNLQAGRELLEKDLRRLGLLQADLVPVLQRFNVATVDDLYVLVALGDVGPNQVGRALLELERERDAPAEPAAPTLPLRQPRRVPKATDSQFHVVGVDNLLVQVARCCRPVPGEPIAGYLTRARGVTVHRRDCPSFLRLSANEPQRVLPVEWGRAGVGHESDVLVEAVDRRHLLKDLSNVIAQEDVHVLSIQSETLDLSRVRLRLRVRVADYGQLARLLGKLDDMPGVDAARR